MDGFISSEARVEGLGKLRRTLKKAGGDVSELRAANLRAAQIILPIAQALAPRTTGRLAASMRATATPRAGSVKTGRKALPYAGPIHWGWPARNIKPNPWVASAAQDNEQLWIEAYVKHVSEAIDQVEGVRKWRLS